MTGSSRLAVVVINYNTRTSLADCLQSLPAGQRTIVVDNASSDGSREMVASQFPRVKLVCLQENRGYGAACNIGIGCCDERYVLVLNSDTIVDEKAISAITQYMDSDESSGIVGPRLQNIDGTLQLSCFPFPGSMGWLIENPPVTWVVSKIPAWRRRTLRFSPPENSTNVPWVLGAALAIRRDAFESVGGFDESYFMYYEEVDLCRRMTMAGWKIAYMPEAIITHVGGVSASKVRSSMVIQRYRSTLRYYRRHSGGMQLHLWLLAIRLKTITCLVRDSLLLLTAQDERRAFLEENVQIWRRALREH